MNKKPLVVTLLSALTMAGIFFGTSCKKDFQNGGNRPVVAGGAPGTCPDSTIHGVITSDLFLKSCTIYKLDSLVYVANGATLTIEAGTRIQGKVGSNTVGGFPGGGLIVTRGAKIVAVGTASNPIVFTSDAAVPKSGDWAGVVLIGKAKTNWATSKIIEGIPGTPIADASYANPGDTLSNDNSGILKYVRIEYGGYAFSLNNEINGLTLAGVGKGTTLDYIEVFKANDDAFEWFGGNVDASHLLAVDAVDDMFDTDNGYSGKISYALGLSDTTRADQSQSNGFESDNDATGSSNLPITHPTYEYVTIVGLANAARSRVVNDGPNANGKYGRAAHLRRNAEFNISKSIFLGFDKGISFDTQFGSTYTKFTGGTSTISNSFVHGYTYAFDTEVNFASWVNLTTPATANQGYVATDANASIKLGTIVGKGPFNRDTIANFIPKTSLPASPAVAAGAFPTGQTAWANGWTRLR